jgi:hypothetical protein
MPKLPKCSPMINRKKTPMPYTLITSQGKVMAFYLMAAAEMYQKLEGGTITTGQIPILK